MAGRLDGKVAIVTGAGRGIGRGEALALAAEGAAVVVNDLGASEAGEGADSTPAEQVVAEITSQGGRAVANYSDVSDFDAAGEMVRQALDELNAVIAVHLTGTFNTVKHAAIVMRQQRSGRIINTSSSSGLGNAGQANYAAAKEGIVGLTRTVARDLGRYGVTCNALRPAAATRLTQSTEMEAARQARIARGESAGSMGSGMAADGIAPLVVYLASDEAWNINGRDFAIRAGSVGLYTVPQVEASAFARGDSWTTDEMFEVFPRTLGPLLTNAWAPKDATA